MQDVIKIILDKHKNLFGINPEIIKINIGFTNTIYKVNDKYILKICNNLDNEKSFKREIDFYNSNKITAIPKLYYSDTTKKDIPFYYEIIEKLAGVSLYKIWNTLAEEKREDIIKQLCEIIKQIHTNKGNCYDWTTYLKDEFLDSYLKVKEHNIFTKEEENIIDYALSKFDKYLECKDFVLIHNDLHFDNIIYKDGKIKLIDFERSMYAPRDFELDILYRMVRCPWKFASEEDEEYVDSVDYSNIKMYVEKYYNELVNNPFLTERLAIYDMVYYIKQLVNHLELAELKDNIIKAAKIIAFKDELRFDNLKTPQQLMDYMNINIEYGWIDKLGKKHINNLKNFRENYRISTIEEVIETGLGTCIEQAKLIKLFFDNNKIANKLYCYRRYENKDNFDQEVKMHCFVIYNDKNKWYQFEHSNSNRRGIHEYDSLDEAIKETLGDEDKEDIRELTEIPDIPEGITYKQFNDYVNTFETIMTQ